MKFKKFVLNALMVGVVLAGTTAIYAQSLPSVSLDSFDSVSYSYIYKILVPEDVSIPFGYFQIDSQVVSGGAQWKLFSTASKSPFDGKSVIRRFNSSFSSGGTVQIFPGAGSWSGIYTMVVPNSRPVWGKGVTQDGLTNTKYEFDLLVPGPLNNDRPTAPVPEPASIALVTAGLAGVVARRRSAR